MRRAENDYATGSLRNTFSQAVFSERERVLERNRQPEAAIKYWTLRWYEDVKAGEKAELAEGTFLRSGVLEMADAALMCCPEDQLCQINCKATQTLCYDCQIPICASCRYCLAPNVCAPMALLNDNFISYIDP